MKKEKQTITLKRNHLAALLDSTNGTIFSVVFTKKPAPGFARGEERKMVTRNHVHKDVKGTGAPLTKPNLRRQYDITLRAWRTINLDTTSEVHANGVIYKIVG